MAILFNPEDVKTVYELISLGKTPEKIVSLEDYRNEAFRITSDQSLLDLDIPESPAKIGKKTYAALEKQITASVTYSLSNWLTNPRNIAKTARNFKEVEDWKEKERKEREKWEAEQKKFEEERKNKDEEKKPKEEERKVEEKKLTPEEDENQTPELYRALGINKKIDEEISNEEVKEAYQKTIENKSLTKNQLEEAEKAYFILADPETRSEHLRTEKLRLEKEAVRKAEEAAVIQAGISETTKEIKESVKDSTWKLIIGFNPHLNEDSPDWADMKDQMLEAQTDTEDYRNRALGAGLLDFNNKEIEKLKRLGYIPKDFSDAQAIAVLNTAHRVIASGGTAKGLLEATEKSTDIDPNQKSFFDSVILNVAAIQAGNPIFTKNLRLANGNPDIEIRSVPSSQLTGNGFTQIVMDFSTNVLMPVFDKIKGQAGDFIKTETKKFIIKSLESKAAKKIVALAAKWGLKATVSAIAQTLGSSVPVIGNVLAWIATELLFLAGKFFGKIFDVVKKFIKENKDVFTGAGLILLGAGALTGSGFLIGAGTVLILLPFIAGGVALVAAGAIGATTAALAFIAATAPIGFVALWIVIGVIVLILLTILTLFIINSGGFVLPQLYETGPGFFPPDCLGTPPPVPPAGATKVSADGQHFFPVGEFQVPGYSYRHWDDNKAVDIFSPLQRPPILAQESGRIRSVVLNDSLGGKYIKMEGASDRWYYYAHLCHVFVKQGQSVSAGQVIATMDETGSGRVQHLHYAINDPNAPDLYKPGDPSYFYGGDGNICPQSDFEEKFNFNICTDSLAISILTGKPRCCIR